MGAVGDPAFDHLPSKRAPRGRPAGAAEGPRRLRQPAPDADLAGPRRRGAAAARDRARRGPADRARADRRPVLRRAAPDRSRSAAKRSTRCATRRPRSSASRTSPSTRPGAGASTSRRSTRPTCSRPRSCGAPSSTTSRPSYPDVALDHMYVDSCAMALVTQPVALRRHPHREPVRRHPVGRGGGDRRLDRPAALGEPGQRPGPLRAGARLGARHRRPGQGQPARHDRVAGDAASGTA